MIWNYTKADPTKAHQLLKEATDVYFSSSPDLRTLDENWNIFKKTVCDTMESCIPHKLSKGKISHPWISRDIVRHMRKRDRLYHKAKASKDQKDWAKYKVQRNKVQRLVEKAHMEYLNNIVGNSLASDGKMFWSYVKSKRKETLGIPTLKTSSGMHYTSQSKAAALNAQFSSVFLSFHQ